MENLRFDLNLKQLKVFYFVARHLSFTQAAKELFITQPAVTKQIDALEQHCEARLFVRERSKLTLTDAGDVLFSYAEQIMRLAFEAERAVSNLRTNPHGILRIGTTKTFARYLLPSYILRFHQAFPLIQIQLDEGSSQDMAQSVVHGRHDLGVVGRVPYDQRLEFIPFPSHEADDLMVVLHPEHPLANRERLDLEDIREEPLLLREKGSGTRRLILERFRERGIEPRILLEASNVGFIKDWITRGVGIGILGLMSIREELNQGLLAAIPLATEGLAIHIDLVIPREGYRPMAVRSFLGFLLGESRT